MPAAERTFDVAIVGAGPAGGAAALELSGRGIAVAVIEKAVPPRYKTCGGGVLARALKLLPIDVRAAVERECHATELVHHGPPLRFISRREQPIVSMVMRDAFDHLLLQTAMARGGVTLFAGTAVADVRIAPDLVNLVTAVGDIAARFVIAADGVNSIVARKTGRPALRDVIPALECEAVYPAPAMEAFMATARFDFGLVPGGYGWVFPKRDHLSVGVGTCRRGAVNLPEFYRRYVEVLGLGQPESERRHGYMIPCRPRDKMFEVPRVLFVGDAAGLADPLTAEGITGGILSGQLAARAVREGEFALAAVSGRYAAALGDALLADLRVARILAWLVYERPRWYAALLGRQGRGMTELMTRIVTGESTYRAAVRRPTHYLRLFASTRCMS